jgi:hypothetical protein
MRGLLDMFPDMPEDPNKRDALSMGLLSLGATMLANANKGFGVAAGHGLLGGVQGYQAGLKSSMDTRQKQMELNLRKQLFGELAGEQSTGTAPPQAVQTSLTEGAANGSIGPTVQNASLLPQAPRQLGPSLRTLQQMAVLGMPGTEPLFNMYKYQTDGIERKPGSFYENPVTKKREFVPDLAKGITSLDGGQSVTPIPGFNETVVSLEGQKTAAQKEAESRYALLPLGYTGQDGRPIGGTVGSYINSIAGPTGMPPAQAPAPSRPAAQRTQPMAPAGFPTISRQEQAGRNAEQLRILQEEYTNERDPANRAALGREIARVSGGKPPVLQSEAERKQQLGQIEIDQKAQERKTLAPLEITQGAQTDLNKNWITATHNPVQEAGQAAKAVLSQLDTLANINFQTGWGAEAKASAANVLASLGVKDASKYASDAQKFQQVAMERNMTMLAAQKGPQTEGDSQRAQQTFVKLSNTPQANQYIADLTRANANQAAKRAAFYAEALPLARAQGDLTEIDRRWQRISGSIWNDPVLAKYKGGK